MKSLSTVKESSFDLHIFLRIFQKSVQFTCLNKGRIQFLKVIENRREQLGWASDNSETKRALLIEQIIDVWRPANVRGKKIWLIGKGRHHLSLD